MLAIFRVTVLHIGNHTANAGIQGAFPILGDSSSQAPFAGPAQEALYRGGGVLHSTVVFIVHPEIRKTQVPIPPPSETENRYQEAPVVKLDLNRRNNKRCIIFHSFVLIKMTLQIFFLFSQTPGPLG